MGLIARRLTAVSITSPLRVCELGDSDKLDRWGVAILMGFLVSSLLPSQVEKNRVMISSRVAEE